jgi:hypothetical protein
VKHCVSLDISISLLATVVPISSVGNAHRWERRVLPASRLSH